MRKNKTRVIQQKPFHASQNDLSIHLIWIKYLGHYSKSSYESPVVTWDENPLIFVAKMDPKVLD